MVRGKYILSLLIFLVLVVSGWFIGVQAEEKLSLRMVKEQLNKNVRIYHLNRAVIEVSGSFTAESLEYCEGFENSSFKFPVIDKIKPAVQLAKELFGNTDIGLKEVKISEKFQIRIKKGTAFDWLKIEEHLIKVLKQHFEVDNIDIQEEIPEEKKEKNENIFFKSIFPLVS